MQVHRQYDDHCFQQANEFVDTGRVLAVTSGNAQNFTTTHLKSAVSGTRTTSYADVPAIAALHGNISARVASTRNSIADRRNVVFKRLLHRLKLCERLQQHPEYKRYRERERKDISKHTKKVVWTDEMEEAFSNALINIPPMGRRKRSQRGRTFGRNELISEWILYETGEERTRKQISSHIQVFDKYFAESPEWQRLSRGRGDSATLDLSGHDYYNNSVEEMVRDWPEIKKMLVAASISDSDTMDMPPVLPSNDSFEDRHRLERVEFEMWIGPSANVDKHLHDFTKMVRPTSSNDNVPLEDLHDWRHRYPDLELTLEDCTTTRSCEVVMISSTFRVMDEFPQEQLKLGISFLLEFSDPFCTGVHPHGCLETFSCITRIYQQGKYLRQTEEYRCQAPSPGKVKPPFESKWWAQEFVQLTQQQRLAEESGDTAAIAAAIESRREFFQGLTMMQQIFTDSPAPIPFGGGSDMSGHGHRAAILLWRFDQALSGTPGVTEWHRLSLPPSRDIKTSSSLAHEYSMSTHNMDTMIRGIDHPLYSYAPSFPFAVNSHAGQLYSPEEEVCQDGYMFVAQQNNIMINYGPQFLLANDMQRPEAGHYLPSSKYILPSQDDPIGQQTYADNLATETLEKNGLDHQSLDPSQLTRVDGNKHAMVSSPGRARTFGRQHALDAFDANTHAILQTQLNLSEDGRQGSQTGQSIDDQLEGVSPTTTSFDEERMADASEKSRCISDDMKAQRFANHRSENVNSIEFPQDRKARQSLFAAPVPVRPPLQQYHSFAGILTTDETYFGTPRRSFVKMLEQVGDNISDSVDEIPSLATIHDLVDRAHSLPPPLLRDDISPELALCGVHEQGWLSSAV